MVSSIQIHCIPVLSDNYVWMLHDEESGDTVVVDPSVAAPVLNAANAQGWRISQIWNTHWHPDHVGGNAEIKAATGCTITGPAKEAAKIGTLDRLVGEGDCATIGQVQAHIWDVPAHTAGHIAYYLPEISSIFVGDTLFAMGCGRLFEGTAEQMFHAMQRFAALNDETMVYCAHEYTLSNARFALAMEPDNPNLIVRMADVEALRRDDVPTIPTSIGLERATNPFMRANTVDDLARLRSAKDSF